MTTNLLFSGEVFKRRLQLGFTQAEMAEILNVTPRWYLELENGRKMPKTKLMLQMCRFLDIDMNPIRDTAPLNEQVIEQVKSRKRKEDRGLKVPHYSGR